MKNYIQYLTEFYEDIAYAFSDEIESDHIDDAYKMAKKHGIGVLSDKEIYAVAILNNEVIGALWTSWMSGEFSWDIVVHDKYQRQGLGDELVNIAIREYDEGKEAFDNPIMRVDVINKVMEKMLLGKGFEIESQVPNHTIMVKQ